MADDADAHDKTEDATPRRRQEARERGQVAMSQELLSTLTLTTSATILILGGGMLATYSGGLIRASVMQLGDLGTQDIDAMGWARVMLESLRPMALPLAFVVVPIILVTLLAGYGQVGFQITPKAIEWDLSKLNPIKGFGRFFKMRSMVRTLGASLKITAITTVTVMSTWKQIPKIQNLAGSELGPTLVGVGHVLLEITIAALIAIASIAVFDWLYQRWQHERDMMMTKKELRDDAKSSEGDPHVKGRIRQLQREMAKRRMMSDVPKATVIITNPTHYAVALRYEGREETVKAAPFVVAKGVDEVAEKIKEIARKHDVICYEDVPLARALHAQVEIGQEIPEALYQAVAAVLAYVYKLRESTAGIGAGR